MPDVEPSQVDAANAPDAADAPVPAHAPQADGRVHGVIIGMTRPSDGRFLLIQRGRNVALAPLQIAFPGGGIEPGEAPADTAVREALEEVGLAVTVGPCLWDWLSPYRPLRLYGFAGVWSENEADIVPQPREVERILWMNLQEIEEAVKTGQALPGTEAFAQTLLALDTTPPPEPPEVGN